MDLIFSIFSQETNRSKDLCQEQPWGYNLHYAKNCYGDIALRNKDNIYSQGVHSPVVESRVYSS